MEPCCSVFLLRAISLQRYSVTVPYGEYFCLHQKENCSGLRAISLRCYSVTVPYGEYFCYVKRKIVLGFGHFVTALQCDSSVWRVFLFASKGKLFWALDISLQRYSVTVPFKGVCRQRKFASLLGFFASERVLLKAGGVVN